VVLGANFDFSAVVGTDGGFAKAVPPSTTLIPAPGIYDDRVGYVAFFPDPLDGKIRTIRFQITDLQLAREAPRQGEVPYSALSTRALEKLGHGDRLPRDLEAHRIRFTANDAYAPRIALGGLRSKDVRQNFGDGSFFKDKVVMIGSSGAIAHDVFPTPMAPDTPGPLIHLHAIAAALDGEFPGGDGSADWLRARSVPEDCSPRWWSVFCGGRSGPWRCSGCSRSAISRPPGSSTTMRHS
jgi:CHASE2 domain-containing sensor protein